MQNPVPRILSQYEVLPEIPAPKYHHPEGVGMDALSAEDRLKMEAARSIREDFLHQNSFHEVDTYTSLKSS